MYWLYTVGDLIVSAIDNLKMMAGGHTVHEWQAIFIDHGSHFPYILYGEREGADPQRGVAVIT